MSLKIVLLTPSLDAYGGAERQMLRIAERFDARIHCLRYDPDATYEGFRDVRIETPKPNLLHRVGARLFGPLETARYFLNLKLDDFDLVNAHLEPSEFARSRNSPMLWYCHTPYRFAFDLYDWKMKQMAMPQKLLLGGWAAVFKHFEYRMVPKIERILTNSLNCQGRIKRYLGRDAEVIPGGVDAERFSCKGNERFFFYPSRISPNKDFGYAIEAFRRFSSRNPGWKLVIAGGLSWVGTEHIYLKRLRSMCAMPGASITIETNITEERLRDLYSRAYAVLYTPIDEDFGLVPLESLASSKPCIARNEGGPKETIINGVDGFLVDSVQDMTQRMEFLAKNPETCVSMGKAGRKKVVERFSWDLFLERFEKNAKEVVDQCP